jgi:glycosyltransferase involved in cell wall biosynthesis
LIATACSETLDAAVSLHRPLKVLHLIAPASFGGLERVVYALATSQLARKYDVRVVSLLDAGPREPPVMAELRAAGVAVVPLVHGPRSYRAQRRSILDLCELVQPDVIHSHGYLPDGLSAALGSRLNAIRVTTVHGFTRGGWRNRLNEWLQVQSYRRVDAVVAVSRKLATELSLSNWLRNKVRTVPNAWTPMRSLKSRDTARREMGLTDSAFTIGWVGRISHEKGLDILIDALPRLGDVPLRVVVIGDGSERQRLRAEAADLGLSGRVIWLGEMRDAASLMSGFDLLVISSRTEGTPITLFEALHAGVPVIATNVGGIPDVVSGAEAVLIPPDAPSALAAAIRSVHGDSASAAARAGLARERLERDFAVGPWVAAYEGIYRSTRMPR